MGLGDDMRYSPRNWPLSTRKLGLLDFVAAFTAILTLIAGRFQWRSEQTFAAWSGGNAKNGSIAASDGKAKATNDKEDEELAEEERVKLMTLVQTLDSDSFDERSEARMALLRLGRPAFLYCCNRLDLEQDALTPEVKYALETLVEEIGKQFEPELVKRIQATIERAVNESPDRYAPLDQSMLRKLDGAKINGHSGASCLEHLTTLSKSSGMRLVIDAEASNITDELQGHPWNEVNAVGNLEQLEWNIRHEPDNNLDFVIRRDMIVLTTKERAQKLRMQHLTLDLPVGPGDAPWSLAETKRLLEILTVFPLGKAPVYQCMNRVKLSFPSLPLKFNEINIVGPGRICVCAEDWVIRVFWQFIDSTFKDKLTPLNAQLDTWERELNSRLNRRIDLELTGLSAETFNTRLSGAIGICFATQFSAKYPELVVAHGVTLRKFLFNLAVENKWLLRPSKEVWSLGGPYGAGIEFCEDSNNCVNYLVGDRFAIDLLPAIKRGASLKELTSVLEGILRDARLDIGIMNKGDVPNDFKQSGCFHSSGFELRGRFFGQADPWTLRRIEIVVAHASETGKVLEAPPKPWFFATWPLATH